MLVSILCESSFPHLPFISSGSSHLWPSKSQVGNSGLGPFNFAISAWQNLLYLAGWDPAFDAGTVPCGDGGCVLGAYGQVRSSTYCFNFAHWMCSLDECNSNSTSSISFALLLNSQLHRPHLQRSLLCLTGSPLPLDRILCRLRNLQTLDHDWIHCTRLGL